MGAKLSDPPGLVFVYNQELGSETFRKVMLTSDGEWFETTCTVGLCLGIEDWRIWDLGSGLYIAYDKRAVVFNEWWMQLRRCMQNHEDDVPLMYGDLIVFRYRNSVDWNELELRRELINFLVTRYRRGREYKFFDVQHNGSRK